MVYPILIKETAKMPMAAELFDYHGHFYYKSELFDFYRFFLLYNNIRLSEDKKTIPSERYCINLRYQLCEIYC